MTDRDKLNEIIATIENDINTLESSKINTQSYQHYQSAIDATRSLLIECKRLSEIWEPSKENFKNVKNAVTICNNTLEDAFSKKKDRSNYQFSTMKSAIALEKIMGEMPKMLKCLDKIEQSCENKSRIRPAKM